MALYSILFVTNRKLTEVCDYMKKQLQGIAIIILVSILLMIGFGNEAVFDFSVRWSTIFAIIGIVGTVMTSCPKRSK